MTSLNVLFCRSKAQRWLVQCDIKQRREAGNLHIWQHIHVISSYFIDYGIIKIVAGYLSVDHCSSCWRMVAALCKGQECELEPDRYTGCLLLSANICLSQRICCLMWTDVILENRIQIKILGMITLLNYSELNSWWAYCVSALLSFFRQQVYCVNCD